MKNHSSGTRQRLADMLTSSLPINHSSTTLKLLVLISNDFYFQNLASEKCLKYLTIGILFSNFIIQIALTNNIIRIYC